MRWALFLVSSLAIAGEFTTSLGDAYPYTVAAITTDSAGNTYVVGSRTLSSSFTDIFVSKLDPSGNLLFTDRFGGSGTSTGSAIALDPSGNIYIAGSTSASDFPLSKALQTQPGIYGAGFVMKLSNDGTTILYSTYFGGTQGPTSIAALITDPKGNLYLTGMSAASDFPSTPGMPTGTVRFMTITTTSGAFIAQISAAGDKLVYAGLIVGHATGCVGGSSCFFAGRFTAGVGIALDAAGNAYFAGNTNTLDLPVTSGAYSATGVGAFAGKISAGGALAYLTYVDSAQTQFNPLYAPATTVYGIAVDASGDAFLCGSTNDSSFPTTSGTIQPVFASGPNPDSAYNVPVETFLIKLNSTGSALLWGTFLGGVGTDTAQAIALDSSGNIWLTGTAQSSSFPNANGWSTGEDYLAEINASATKLLYSARYPSGSAAQAVALDPAGLVHIAGSNGFISAISPGAAPVMSIFGFQNAFGGNLTARITPWEVISIYGPGIGPTTAVTGAPVNGVYPTTLGGVQVTIDGASMPLLYVSANQINAVVPSALTANAASAVHIATGTAVSPDYPVWIDRSAPVAYPVVLNQDGTINSRSNGAKFNSIVTFYATGWQNYFAGLADGQVAATAQNACAYVCQASVETGGFPWIATVLYGGAAPGIVAGVSQINLNVGAGPGVLAGEYTFDVTGTSTLSVPIWIAP